MVSAILLKAHFKEYYILIEHKFLLLVSFTGQPLMQEIRKISTKAISLLIDTLVFAFQIVKKVVLPTLNRKGNILSSLLTFFVGLIERILSFEKGILGRSLVFRYRFVKQGLIIVVGFLFLLSSIEWTVGQSAAIKIDETQSVVIQEPAVYASSVFAKRHISKSRQIPGTGFFTPGLFPYKLRHALYGDPVTVKRYLRFCIFRI